MLHNFVSNHKTIPSKFRTSLIHYGRRPSHKKGAPLLARQLETARDHSDSPHAGKFSLMNQKVHLLWSVEGRPSSPTSRKPQPQRRNIILFLKSSQNTSPRLAAFPYSLSLSHKCFCLIFIFGCIKRGKTHFPATLNTILSGALTSKNRKHAVAKEVRI